METGTRHQSLARDVESLREASQQVGERQEVIASRLEDLVRAFEESERRASEERERDRAMLESALSSLSQLNGEASIPRDQGQPNSQARTAPSDLPPAFASLGAAYAMQDQSAIAKWSPPRDQEVKFTGVELVEDSYALIKYMKFVIKIVNMYGLSGVEATTRAAFYLGGSALTNMDTLLSEGRAPTTMEELYATLRRWYQPEDIGVKAMLDFERARQGRVERPVDYLSRLHLYSYAMGFSEDETVRRPEESDVARKFRTSLRSDVSMKLEAHIRLIKRCGGTPPTTVGALSAEATRIWMELKVVEKGSNLPGDKKFPGKFNTIAKDSSQPKWAELSDEARENIRRVQQELSHVPLGAKLAPEQKVLCDKWKLCYRCHRYGHDTAKCTSKGASTGMRATGKN